MLNATTVPPRYAWPTDTSRIRVGMARMKMAIKYGMNHCRPMLLKTCEGYRMILPCPTAPPTDANRKAVLDGHWSLPSSDCCACGTIFERKPFTLTMVGGQCNCQCGPKNIGYPRTEEGYRRPRGGKRGVKEVKHPDEEKRSRLTFWTSQQFPRTRDERLDAALLRLGRPILRAREKS